MHYVIKNYLHIITTNYDDKKLVISHFLNTSYSAWFVLIYNLLKVFSLKFTYVSNPIFYSNFRIPHFKLNNRIYKNVIILELLVSYWLMVKF